LARIALSRSAFFHNLTFLSQKLGGKEKLAIVLKDNAYGHGLLPIAGLANEYGLTRAVVRTFGEAEAIKTLFDHILILNPTAPFISDSRYTLTVNDLTQLQHIPPQTKIDLKIDTGMHRNGIHADDLETAFRILASQKLILNGIFTHFRSADVLSSELFWQMQHWRGIKEKVKTLCNIHAIPLPIFHSANSAATLRIQSYEDDFARCGIAAYGYHEMPEIFGNYDLKPVLSLYAHKITTIKLKKGEKIGYGGLYRAQEDMTVSTYDFGYGDGFLRYNGEGKLYLNGMQILGKISMDSLCVKGEKKEIALIGDAKEIAHAFGTISYDVLVKLNPGIERIIVR
jgi:alanine racemase